MLRKHDPYFCGDTNGKRTWDFAETDFSIGANPLQSYIIAFLPWIANIHDLACRKSLRNGILKDLCAAQTHLTGSIRKNRSRLIVTQNREEAAPIARLVGDADITLAWVYRWNTGELSLLWLRQPDVPLNIEPPIDPTVLAEARECSDATVVSMLDELSQIARKLGKGF